MDPPAGSKDEAGRRRHFTDKAKKHGFSHFDVEESRAEDKLLFRCRVLLPPVLLCEVQPLELRGAGLWMSFTPWLPSKARAKEEAAFDACCKLHDLGTLDDHLCVKGRRQLRQKLLDERPGGRGRGGSRGGSLRRKNQCVPLHHYLGQRGHT